MKSQIAVLLLFHLSDTQQKEAIALHDVRQISFSWLFYCIPLLLHVRLHFIPGLSNHAQLMCRAWILWFSFTSLLAYISSYSNHHPCHHHTISLWLSSKRKDSSAKLGPRTRAFTNVCVRANLFLLATEYKSFALINQTTSQIPKGCLSKPMKLMKQIWCQTVRAKE